MCNDTVDWVSTPLATVRSLSPPDQNLPCNLKWSNLQMLMSDQSCVRFTAASAGPVYFALSAVPSDLKTWYYIRISQVIKTIFTESADWANSVIESRCPGVRLSVCDNSKHPLPEVVETSG